MKKSKKPYHLVMYVEDSNPKIKKFATDKAASDFIDQFRIKYPDSLAIESGNWLDYVVTGVTGDVTFFTDGIEVE